MDEPIIERTLLNPSSSAMRRVVGRFGKKQAAIGSGGKYSATPSLFHDVFEILLRLETEK
jgi:hypothetical protein